jgi:hypothetical protein
LVERVFFDIGYSWPKKKEVGFAAGRLGLKKEAASCSNEAHQFPLAARVAVDVTLSRFDGPMRSE